MRNTAPPTIRPHPIQAYQARFAWLLVVAVLLHALVLLIPARQVLLPGPTLRTLTVALTGTWHAPPPANLAEGARRESTPAKRRPARPGTPNAASPPAAAPRAEPPLPTPGAGVQAGNARAPVTTARLLDFARQREWSVPEASAPRLGLLTLPPSDPRPVTPATSVTLSRTAGPSTTGIVDQWLAADGSSNRMIRTPNGELLCGRAEAWNPMSPLVEPVMMYRACGDGRRTFEMPERVLLR